jgi:hypothetical protein
MSYANTLGIATGLASGEEGIMFAGKSFIDVMNCSRKKVVRG